MLNVVRVITGFLEENCYIIHNGVEALIVDPGADLLKIKNQIITRSLKVKGILITHSHFDHIGALEEVKESYPDAEVIDFNTKGDKTIDTFKFKILETPGHTSDSVSYYFSDDEILFSGDFIFKGTIGNYDNTEEEHMANSLNIFKYIPDEVIIYPGHGESTTVGEELKNNPFLRGI